MRNKNRGRFAQALPGLTLAVLLAHGCVAAQESSVILKSLDDLEKRVIEVEAEWLANLRARKSFGRLKPETGLFPDPADPDGDAFGAGLRMTSNFK